MTLFPLSAGVFAGHSNGKLLIFICPLDFCAGLHILEVGNAIRPISMGFHAKTKPPRSGNSEGVLVLVLTALTHQAVKPLAQIIGYYLCYATATTAASGGNREELLGPRPARCECRPRHKADAGSRNPYRMPEGPQCQYNTSSDPIQQKAPGTANTGGFLFSAWGMPYSRFRSR